MAIEIIDRTGPVTFKHLADTTARAHGLLRTGKVIRSVVWRACAGHRRHDATPDGHKVFWPDRVDAPVMVDFRGLHLDGYSREWNDIPHPEKLGLLRDTLRPYDDDPVRTIATAIGIGRGTSVFQAKISELMIHLDNAHRATIADAPSGPQRPHLIPVKTGDHLSRHGGGHAASCDQDKDARKTPLFQSSLPAGKAAASSAPSGLSQNLSMP